MKANTTPAQADTCKRTALIQEDLNAHHALGFCRIAGLRRTENEIHLVDDEVVFENEREQALANIIDSWRKHGVIGREVIRHLHALSHLRCLLGRERLSVSQQDLILLVELLNHRWVGQSEILAQFDDIVLQRRSDGDLLPATDDVLAQLTGAEWLWNLPGSAEEKHTFTRTCGGGCHGYDQIMRNRLDERSWRLMLFRMLHYSGSPLIVRGRARGNAEH